jgi:hypothetical protein
MTRERRDGGLSCTAPIVEAGRIDVGCEINCILSGDVLREQGDTASEARASWHDDGPPDRRPWLVS